MMKKTKRTAGLWIDHRKAVIVKNGKISIVLSNVEKQLRRSNGLKVSTQVQQASANDIRDREFMGHLNAYYKKVISCIGDAESILIFGPGEAKGELKKRILKNKLGGRIVGLETVDKMTDRQIAAKVRQYFL